VSIVQAQLAVFDGRKLGEPAASAERARPWPFRRL